MRFFIFIITLLLASSVFALSLPEAKSKGWIGEQSNGYVGVVDNNIPATQKNAVTTLMQKINTQRKAEYLDIASNNGTSVSQVQSVAGNTLIGLAKPGEYVKSKTGVWVKK